jgi:hypothetical protein
MAENQLRRPSQSIPIGLLALLLMGVAGPLSLGQDATVRPTKAQERSPERAEQEEEREAVEREMQQVLQLLRQASDVAHDIPDPVVRIRSYALIAEALWELDQPLARRLFRTAFEETRQIPVPERPKGVRAWLGSTRDPDKLRQEILAKVSKLDPTFAIELAKSVEVEKRESEELQKEATSEVLDRRRATGSERARALMNLANLLLEKDPESAAEAAAAVLSEGVTQPFVQFLMRLRQKDPARADRLFLQALQTTTRNVPPRLYELIPLGSYVASEWRLPMRFSVGGEPPPVNPSNAARYLSVLLDSLAQYVEIAVNPALASGLARADWFTGPRELHHILTAIRPHVQEYLPDRVPLVDALLNQLAIQQSAQPRVEVETAEAGRTRSPEERFTHLLQRAERTRDVEERDALLFQAISQALSDGKFETAASVVPRLSDLTQRAEVSDYVYYTWAERALSDGDLETARRSASEVNNPERLAVLFGAIARRLEAQKDKETALLLLQEAATRIQRLPTSPEKGRALMLLVEALLPLDADRAFEMFAYAISSLNAPGVLAESLGANFQFNFKGMGLVIGVAERDIMLMLERVITALTTTDPARTSALLTGVENPPLRLIAQLAYARRHLEILKEKRAKLAERRPG